jgi:hypothetical protein
MPNHTSENVGHQSIGNRALLVSLCLFILYLASFVLLALDGYLLSGKGLTLVVNRFPGWREPIRDALNIIYFPVMKSRQAIDLQ